MKFVKITATVIALGLFACNHTTKYSANAAAALRTTKMASPIDGNWVLVSNEVNGKLVTPKRSPQQFKMFHDGFYAFVMYDSSGKFYLSGAGPFELNGSLYKETLTYSSDTTYNDAKDWQRWEMKGDTLIFYGFEKVELGNGNDVTKEWGNNKFIEKRVRAK